MSASLASALMARDPGTAAHSSRVTFLVSRLAAWLGWSEAEQSTIRVGARLHDIGKVSVSQEILSKRGPLDQDELAEIRTHPAAGAQLVGIDGPVSDALPYVLYHHERWDGRGYPTGTAGEAVPIGARLLAVVDAFDAMTSTRPYRRALPVERALAEIERCAGSQFDPTLARAFLDAWDAGVFQLPDVVAR